jgi:hypothetical protein
MYHLVDKFACRAATGILETLATTACSKRHGRRRAATSTTSRLSCPRLEPAAARRLDGMPTKRLIERRPEVEPMSGNESTRIERTSSPLADGYLPRRSCGSRFSELFGSKPVAGTAGSPLSRRMLPQICRCRIRAAVDHCIADLDPCWEAVGQNLPGLAFLHRQQAAC